MSAMSFWVPRLFDAVMATAAGQFPSDAKGWELLDNNPDNSITSSSSSALTVLVDRGSGSINASDFSGFWATGGVPASGTLTIKSTANADYTTALVTDSTLDISTIGTGRPFIVDTFDANVTRRYLRFEFTSLPAAIELGMVFQGVKYDVAQQWNWDSPDRPRHINTAVATASSRVFSRNMVSATQRILQRRFEFIDSTDATALQNAFNTAKGSHVPVIVTDGTDDPEDGNLMRFTEDQLDIVEVANGLFHVNLNMIEVPYITPGEVF